MSVLTARAALAQKFALMELEDDFARYLADHDEAVDSEGNQILCLFAPDESAHQMMTEALRYPHPVLIGSEVDGQLMAVQLGNFTVAESPSDDDVVRIEEQTVNDVMRKFRSLAEEQGGRASGIVFEFSLSGNRMLVTA